MSSVTATGNTPSVFIEKGVTIYANSYRKNDSTALESKALLEPPSALAQASKSSQSLNVPHVWGKANLSDFSTKEELPSTSPDIHLFDYFMYV